jgi:hypothetical protein
MVSYGAFLADPVLSKEFRMRTSRGSPLSVVMNIGHKLMIKNVVTAYVRGGIANN